MAGAGQRVEVDRAADSDVAQLRDEDLLVVLWLELSEMSLS